MRIVGIDSIICDYYFWKDSIYINGGGTTSNILVQLDALGHSCKLIGYCGKDLQGRIILESLKQTKIELSNLKKVENPTKCFFISNGKTTSECPICHQKKKRYPNLKIESILPYIKKEDIILLHDYSKPNEKIINQIKNQICIDIGYIKPLFYLEEEKILEFIKYPFKIMNLKEEVLNFISKKLKIDPLELLNQMNTDLIVITKGKNGADFFFQHQIYTYQLKEPFPEIETNGCGDAFLSIVIDQLLRKEKWNETDFQEIFERGNQVVKEVLKNIGARNHIISNYKIKATTDCICKSFKIE